MFSQFVGMLTLLKERLAAEGIGIATSTAQPPTARRSWRNSSHDHHPGVPHQPQSGRRRPQSHRCGHRGAFRSVVESSCRRSGHGSCPSHRQTRVVTSSQTHHAGYRGRKILTLQQRKARDHQATIGGEEEFAASLSWAGNPGSCWHEMRTDKFARTKSRRACPFLRLAQRSRTCLRRARV